MVLAFTVVKRYGVYKELGKSPQLRFHTNMVRCHFRLWIY